MNETLTPELAPGDEARRIDPQAVADLMGALERVMRIGVYYPSGHIMCDQAAAHFLRALERTLGKSPSLRFGLAGGRLHVQDVPLDEDLRGVAGFREILTLLGISAVVIDSNVTAVELHDFVTRLLAYRNQVKGAHRFQQVKVEGLPASIAVEHLEFTARDADPDVDGDGSDGNHTGDRGNPTLEALLTALARRGLGPDELERCRRLLEAIPGYLKENRLETAAMPQVSWQDVEKLLVRAVQSASEPAPAAAGHGGPPRSGGNVNLDALTAIFKKLGERAEAENPRHAIDLLLSLSHRGAAAPAGDDGEAPPKPRPKRSDEAREVPVDELRAALGRLRRPGRRSAGSWPAAAAARSWSSCCRCSARDQKLPVQVRIQKRIRDIARTGLDAGGVGHRRGGHARPGRSGAGGAPVRSAGHPDRRPARLGRGLGAGLPARRLRRRRLGPHRPGLALPGQRDPAGGAPPGPRGLRRRLCPGRGRGRRGHAGAPAPAGVPGGPARAPLRARRLHAAAAGSWTGSSPWCWAPATPTWWASACWTACATIRPTGWPRPSCPS